MDFLAVIVTGLAAGLLGGLLGVGGSVIIIPGLTIILGRNQHLYQASAMIVNVAISLPATWQHKRAGAVVPPVIRWMMPAAALWVLIGVRISNLVIFQGKTGQLWLGRLLAIFLVYVIIANVRKLIRPPAVNPTGDLPVIRPVRAVAAGTIMGLIAGLLGIGGGAIAVPLQQVMLRLPLRNCIANSAAVICLSASIGAVYKNISLDLHGLSWIDGVALACLLAPTAWLGGHIGAILTHRLPLRQVRLAFILLMIIAMIKMSGLF